jgi:hypothetical protein
MSSFRRFSVALLVLSLGAASAQADFRAEYQRYLARKGMAYENSAAVRQTRSRSAAGISNSYVRRPISAGQSYVRTPRRVIYSPAYQESSSTVVSPAPTAAPSAPAGTIIRCPE